MRTPRLKSMAVLNLTVLLILLSWTFAVAFLVMTALALQLRSRRLRKLTLRPNCLLTRAPLVFITGPRSLFYFLQYWNSVPRFLYEHGYLVEVWKLPWVSADFQRSSLQRRLRRHTERGGRAIHLFYDASTEAVVDAIRNDAAIASLTKTDDLLTPPPLSVAIAQGPDRWIKFGFDLHRRFSARAAHPLSIGLGVTAPPWQIETRFLDRAVRLAETELTNS